MQGIFKWLSDMLKALFGVTNSGGIALTTNEVVAEGSKIYDGQQTKQKQEMMKLTNGSAVVSWNNTVSEVSKVDTRPDSWAVPNNPEIQTLVDQLNHTIDM